MLTLNPMLMLKVRPHPLAHDAKPRATVNPRKQLPMMTLNLMLMQTLMEILTLTLILMQIMMLVPMLMLTLMTILMPNSYNYGAARRSWIPSGRPKMIWDYIV